MENNLKDLTNDWYEKLGEYGMTRDNRWACADMVAKVEQLYLKEIQANKRDMKKYRRRIRILEERDEKGEEK